MPRRRFPPWRRPAHRARARSSADSTRRTLRPLRSGGGWSLGRVRACGLPAAARCCSAWSSSSGSAAIGPTRRRRRRHGVPGRVDAAMVPAAPPAAARGRRHGNGRPQRPASPAPAGRSPGDAAAARPHPPPPWSRPSPRRLRRPQRMRRCWWSISPAQRKRGDPRRQGVRAPNGGSAGATAANAKLNPDEQFAARVETGPEAEHARATMLREPVHPGAPGHDHPGGAGDGAELRPAGLRARGGQPRRAQLRRLHGPDPARQPGDRRVPQRRRRSASRGHLRDLDPGAAAGRRLDPDRLGRRRHAGPRWVGRQGGPPLLRAVQRRGPADGPERRRVRRCERRRRHAEHRRQRRLQRWRGGYRRRGERIAPRPPSRQRSRWPRARRSASSWQRDLDFTPVGGTAANGAAP